MKMPLRKTLLTMATVLLGVSLLGACSNTSNDSSSKGTDHSGATGPLKLSMMYSDSSAYPFNKDWALFKKLQAQANVDLDVQSVPSPDYNNKLRIVLSSGSIPDLVTEVRQDIVSEFAQNGVLLPLSDYMDKLPNLKKKIEEYQIEDELENWRTKDGKLYVAPVMNETALYNTAPVIRMDLIKKYGLKIPETMDELYAVLKTLKEKDPASFPMANLESADTLRNLSGAAWGIDPSYNGFVYNQDTKSYAYSYTGDHYKQYVSFLHKLITEKLADPELFTTSLDSWKQKMVTGKSVFTYTWISELAQLNADGKKNVSPDFELAPIAPIAGPGGKLAASTLRIPHGIVIPASAAKKPYFDQLLAFLDYLYSDEGSNIVTWGIENDSYEVVDGKKQFTDKITGAASIQRALWDSGASNQNYTMLYTYDWFIKVLDNPLVSTLTEEAIANHWFPPITKVPKLSPDEKEEENMQLTTIKDAYAKAQDAFVFGGMSIETDWNNYVKDMENRGVKKLIDLYNNTLK
ncbi:extracellular solute-binding protein [Paenibacillus sp. HJL G12]|uniref:Extracellular solute-binding protein n=1 Tax=Paenibacillus dendrobii TaxID=2691084 RepID=A0A7X3LGK9_9BACL|nr:extracellular solute-binding protein [Paenibacillus dendrobii]MWV42608.1 extracellular solute-binding protein [Paenibacillus dendrobii]